MRKAAVFTAAALSLAACAAEEEPVDVLNEFERTQSQIENRAAEIEARAENLTSEVEARLANETEVFRADLNAASGENGQADNAAQ